MTLLTPADVALRLSVDPKVLSNMRHRGTGPEFVRINSRCVRYSEQALTEWVAARSQSSNVTTQAH